MKSPRGKLEIFCRLLAFFRRKRPRLLSVKVTCTAHSDNLLGQASPRYYVSETAVCAVVQHLLADEGRR